LFSKRPCTASNSPSCAFSSHPISPLLIIIIILFIFLFSSRTAKTHSANNQPNRPPPSLFSISFLWSSATIHNHSPPNQLILPSFPPVPINPPNPQVSHDSANKLIINNYQIHHPSTIIFKSIHASINLQINHSNLGNPSPQIDLVSRTWITHKPNQICKSS
jgi:hypothetical protein